MGAMGVISPWPMFICLLVTVLLFNEGCKADVGTPCTNGDSSNCTTGEICSSGSCACNTATHYQSGSTCLEKIALSQTCSLGVVQCVTSGAVCATDNICRCNTGTFDNNGFGTVDGECVNMNDLVVSSVGYSNLGATSVTISWAAPSTYSSQVTRYEVTWTSTAGNSNKIGDTSTSLEVTGLQSASQYNFYVRTIESGSQTTEQQVTTTTPLVVTTKSLLGNTCGDCADPNAICSTKCECDSGYYDNDGDTTNVGGTCTQKIALSQTCSNSLVGVVQCVTSGTDCATDNKCRCNTGTFDSNGFGTADGECVNMNDLVVSSVGYSNLGATSVTISWAAPSTYSSQVTRYEVTWTSTAGDGSKTGDTSTSLEVTGLQSASQYSFYVRTIESGSQTTEQQVTTTTPLVVTTKNLLGNTCGDCADANAICSTICVCNSGYYDSDGDTTNVGGTCTQKIALSASCNSALTGVSQCSDGKAECTSTGGNMCRCQDKYFDSNGYGTNGGTCTSMSNLKVTSVTFSSVTTTGVTISWTESATSSQVSSYTVVWKQSGSDTVEGTSQVGKVTTTAITGLSQSTTYVFKVISIETGSRSTPQQIESDASVTVTTKAELSQPCGTILCGDVNSECIAGDSGGNVCRCQTGYYDNDGYSTTGGVCTAMSGLVVTSLSVGVEGTSTVTIQWVAPSPGSDQVNRYEVHWTPALSNGTSNYMAAKTTSVRLTGFTSGQMFTFYVKSFEDGSRDSQQEVQTSLQNITINAGLNVVCDGGITCADSNSECIQAASGGANICRCKSTYFDSNGYSTNGGMCVLMSKLAVTNVILVKEGTDMVSISWTPPSEYTNRVSRYEVHWTSTETISGNTFYNAELTTAVRLAGFTPGQTYTFSVRSVESGSRDQEQRYSTSTPTTIMKPTTPSGFRETDVDGPVIILSWTLPSGISTSYDVRTTPTLNPTTTSTESIAYTSGVLDGQRYNITITTVSGSERSDPLEATFRTVSKTPNPPTSIFCKAATDQTITLGWTAPSLSRGDIQHYVVISITTGAMFTTTSSLADYTVGGLQPETIYTFSVATVNDAVTYTNRSIYSSQIGCTTKAASE